tara:strand:- start:319 stop:624 length:306 start_codon:yes stop_codon:yes gene_type:complete
MTQQENPFNRLKDGSIVMLSIYIETPTEKEAFPFTEQGLKDASQMLAKYWKQIKSDEDEDHTVSMFSDDGVSTIEYVTDRQLTRGHRLMWGLFKSGYYYGK